MALYSRVKTWVSNEILTASDLNGEFNNILDHASAEFLIGGSADLSAMQTTVDPFPASVPSLASSTLGEIQRIRWQLNACVGGSQWYVDPTGNLSTGGIGTATIADLAVTTAKLAASAVTTAKIALGAVTATELASNAVTTVKILDANVTRAKLAAFGQSLSSSCGTFATPSASLVDVTNLAVTGFVSTGRPIWVGLISDGTTSAAIISAYATPAAGSGSAGTNGQIVLNQAGVGTACRWGIRTAVDGINNTITVTDPHGPPNTTATGASSPISYTAAPATSIYQILFLAAGTYDFKIQANVTLASSGSCTVSVENAKLLVYEMY